MIDLGYDAFEMVCELLRSVIQSQLPVVSQFKMMKRVFRKDG